MKKWGVALACAVVAGIALYFTFFRGSEEDRIRTTLAELAKTVAIKDGDNILSRTGRIRSRLKALVDEDVHVNISELSLDVRGRTSFEDAAIKAGLVYQTGDCDFSNLSLKLDSAGTVATVETVAVVTATMRGERKVDRRNVHFLLHKDGDWKITTIDVAEPKRDE